MVKSDRPPITATSAPTRPNVLLTTVIAASSLLLTSCGGQPHQSEAGVLTVFAAASMIKSFDDMALAFERKYPGSQVELSYASSNTLATQIAAGAPADVFAAADPESMSLILDLTVDAPSQFASNTLTVAVPPDNPGQVTGLEDMSRRELVVGLCDPSAPCGRLAAETLAVNGVTAQVDTFEANNQALFTRLQQGELDVALIYRSDAHDADGTVVDLHTPDDAPIDVYEVAVLRRADDREMADAFLEFVLSPEGQAIMHAHGFGRP